MRTPEQAKMLAKAFCPPPKQRRGHRQKPKPKPPVSVIFNEADKKTILWNALYGDSRSVNWWLLLLMTRETDLDTLSHQVGRPKQELEKLYTSYLKGK